jgi:CDP-diacylglycerol--glycerol-3-phosphate 3-phosphatidyltransferase
VLGVNLRPAVGRFWAPVVRGLVRAGVTPDAVTLTGTLGAVAAAVFLIGNGALFWGAFAVTAPRVPVRVTASAVTPARTRPRTTGAQKRPTAGRRLTPSTQATPAPGWSGATGAGVA